MNCTVYKSERKPDTYLYLADHCDFQDLPAELQQTFGVPVKVMKLELSEKNRLARVDVSAVMQELKKNGYFCNCPRKFPPKKRSRSNFPEFAV